MTRKSIKPAERSGSRKFKNDTFFENLQSRRIELGLKQEELAAILGVNRTHVSRMEAGAFPKDPQRLRDIARALKTDLNSLFGFTPEE